MNSNISNNWKRKLCFAFEYHKTHLLYFSIIETIKSGMSNFRISYNRDQKVIRKCGVT